jgi:hypothetical protein
MSERFDLDHSALEAEPEFAALAGKLRKLTPVDSSESFNRYCRAACALWDEEFPRGIGETQTFAGLLNRIERNDGSVIRTAWGGVVITLHEHPRVEKYLVVRKGNYLALEKHEKKDERLEVREGVGLLLWRRIFGRALSVEPLKPGAEFHFEPGIEHCIIGTEDLLVFERGIDPKGMDQDLIFIYQPEASLSRSAPNQPLSA